MKNFDFSTIYNIPEEISGRGWMSHLTGLCLFIALFLCCIPCVSIDNNWLKDMVELIISSGVLLTLGMAFIFIFCPIFFLIRCLMEIFRARLARQKFYSTPNIEYITLNDNNVFFKNTCKNCDFTIQKSDIENVLLDGKVNIFYNPVGKGSSRQITYIENLKMTIKTTKGFFIIYPDIKSKQKKYYIDQIDFYKQLIQFFKNYFDNFNVNISNWGSDDLAKLNSEVIAYELEAGNTVKTNNGFNYLNIILNIIIVIAFVYFIFIMYIS